MDFQIGYQANRKFLDYLRSHADRVSTVYFPWKEFTTGRGIGLEQEQLENDLTGLAADGFKFCLLLNGNCYGSQALSKEFFSRLDEALADISGRFGLAEVTTASPVIAGFIKKHFPAIAVRASVNMEIGTIDAMEYLLEDFDSFYLKREYNYDLERIEMLHDFCRKNGKELHILANSGCLNFCSARTFHDNLVAHQHEIVHEDNIQKFHGVCTGFLRRGENCRNILAKSNFIRPEDIHHYENLCDGMKLATRTNFNPMAIASAYFNASFYGNILDLTEPAHSALLPGEIVANKKIPSDYAQHRFACSKKCADCGYCRNIQDNATVKL